MLFLDKLPLSYIRRVLWFLNPPDYNTAFRLFLPWKGVEPLLFLLLSNFFSLLFVPWHVLLDKSYLFKVLMPAKRLTCLKQILQVPLSNWLLKLAIRGYRAWRVQINKSFVHSSLLLLLELSVICISPFNSWLCFLF